MFLQLFNVGEIPWWFNCLEEMLGFEHPDECILVEIDDEDNLFFPMNVMLYQGN